MRAPRKSPRRSAGEQAHLPAGAAALALDTGGGQCSFAADDGDEGVIQFVEFSGDGVEELGPTCRSQLTELGEGSGSGLGGLVHFGFGGLGKAVGQGFASAGVQALQTLRASGTALTGDEVMAEDFRHGVLLWA